jgi:hypothetical protein
MLKQDQHEDLCGLDHRSVIPYVHERERELYCCVCVTLFKAELNLFAPAVPPVFYSSRLDSYTMTQGPTGSPRVVGSLHSRALLARSSK